MVVLRGGTHGSPTAPSFFAGHGRTASGLPAGEAGLRPRGVSLRARRSALASAQSACRPSPRRRRRTPASRTTESTSVALSRPAPFPLRSRRTPMPPRISAMTSSSSAEVGDDPRRYRARSACPRPRRSQTLLSSTIHCRADPHHDVARAARPGAASSSRAGGSACRRGRTRAALAPVRSRADEDHRAEDVQEEREVPARPGGSWRGRCSCARLPDHVDEDERAR